MKSIDLSGAFWCDTSKFPVWNALPCSAFDTLHKCPDKMLEFRHVLHHGGKGKVLLRFTGGCRFRLLLNGHFLEDGPVEVGGDYGKQDAPNWWFYDELEITADLRPGENTLLFQMFPAGMCQMDYSLGFGWLYCAIQQNGKWKVLPASNWEFRINPHYRNQHFQDFFAKDASTWETTCKDIAVPLKAQFLDLPRLTLLPRQDFRFRFPFGHGKNFQIKDNSLLTTPGEARTFFLAFPEERCGFFEIKWECDRPVVLHLDFQEQYGVPGRTETLQTSASKGSYQTIRLHPFRYVLISLEPSDFRTPQNPRPCAFTFCMYERHFPIAKKTPLPAGSSKTMQAIDDLCLRNVIMCMQRMHLDSPVHQEGLGCTGDYRIEARTEYAAFGECRLAKADIIRTALLLRQQHKMFHTSYALCYVLMFQEYLQFSEDLPLLREYYDTLEIVYRQFSNCTGKTGLLSNAENYLFIDWVNDGPVTYHHPPASQGTGAMTALWYGTLQAMSKMAKLLHKTEDEQKFSHTAQHVRAAFNRELWDAQKQCYLDGIPGLTNCAPSRWLPKDTEQYSASSLTSIMALAYGLPDMAQNPQKLLSKVIEGKLPLRPTPYYMFYLFEAVVRYNLWEKYGKKLILQWKVFLHSGLREIWLAGDYSHGWGSAPAIFMREAARTKKRELYT